MYSYEEFHFPVLYVEAKNGVRYEVYDITAIPLVINSAREAIADRKQSMIFVSK